MGFHRHLQPDAITALRTQTSRALNRLIPHAEIAAALAMTCEPFGIENDCLNPAGHDAIASCGEVVCPHCAKVLAR